jgi:hypothetical protein
MVNAFSFCLYGPPNPYYYQGLLENIWLIGKYFPTWKVYVYLGTDVPQDMRDRLAVCSSVVLRETGITGPRTMAYRFFAIDEPEVEIMLVRDADSRVHWKDRWAIREFIRHPEYIAHAIRDNVVHKVPLCGGLWGMRKVPGLRIEDLFWDYSARQATAGYDIGACGFDQSFLALYVYPRLASRILIHYSNKCLFAGESGVEFPFAWNNETFCGRGEVGVFLDVPDPQVTQPIQRNPLQLKLNEGRLHYPLL